MRYKGLQRRRIRRKPGTKPPEYIVPKKARKSFGQTADYKYLWGHTVTEVAEQLPNKSVICWKTDHFLSLPVCAIRKFVKETKYCKRCPLFQGDEYSDQLKSFIEAWEKDEIELED